ncbi:glycosyl transferase [[Haemophilus] felis]|uniref:Glycosyl transferase family 25 domain-containing protein n=1 Tax=[Haemophilus] felis TaxID=123822 RepID=A0A1T0AZ96_9PAST|nr:glycosyl transferase [[Haemophilus] felis]NBI40666.1 glycosyl transferase [[Haemophilus] felis]OOS03228.1 hypothetical protein B0188_06915 [[Haemophilus] felis]
MPTPIFVINLAKSTERKEFIFSQFYQLNQPLANPISFEFFIAVNGKENPDFYLFQKYNAKKHFQRKCNQLNLSQLGCFASHYLLWEKCVELDQGIIVLEDDAIIHPEFSDVYQFISSAENQFEFFWLSPPSPDKRNQTGKKIYLLPNNTHAIYQFYKSWANATGYYITPKAAKKLLKQCEEWIYEVDTTMERYWENKIALLGMQPSCVEPDFSKESNIPIERANKTLFVKIRREIYQFKDLVQKLVYRFLN